MMNVICTICSDIFLPQADIYTTQCGHLFHYECLIQWIERSKTCPQCRNKTTEKTIYKIFLNLANTDHIVDDVGTLQQKLDSLQFQVTLKEKDISNLKEKYSKTKNQNLELRREISELENKARVHESVVHALKDQISFFKSKSKERDRLVEELSQTKNKLKNLEMIQVAINGTREEVNDILKNECNVESLVLLSATLKKALLDTEKKKLSVDQKYKQLQSEINKYKRDISSLESTNEDLRKELEFNKTLWGREKEQLTKVVKNLKESGPAGHTPVIKRILSESPVPLHLSYTNNSKEVINLDDSTTSIDSTSSNAREDKNVETSDSPYLPVKSSSMSNTAGLLKHATYFKTSQSTKPSIFKGSSRRVESVKLRRTDETLYNGLGGQSKRDIFPSPKNPAVGLKRLKTSSSLNVSKKIRKLSQPTLKKFDTIDLLE